MAGFFALKTIFRTGIIAVALANGAAAQQLIQLDNDVCGRGLNALAETLQTTVRTLTPARKIADQCKAQKVQLNGGGLELEIGEIQWPAGSLSALETGKIPESLNLSISRARVIRTPGDGPFWAFLEAQGAGGKRLDANIGVQYKSAEKELIVYQAGLVFENENSLSLRARFGNVTPDIPENPAVFAAGLLARRIEIRLTSGRTSVNPALAAIRDAIEKDMQKNILGGRDFKRSLKTLVSQKLGTLLSAADMTDLKRLINDAPRARDDILLRMNTADGFTLGQLALIKPEDRLAAVTDNFEVRFAYGSRAH